MKQLLFAAALLLAACGSADRGCPFGNEPATGDVTFESSDKEMELTFNWARKMALSYAHSGQHAVGDWYEAALPGRNAFCMRDAAHQSIGAEILGLSSHNYNMMYKFAENISAEKDWCTYWEIDRDNKPCRADYADDKDFWYNLNANHDVMFACWRLYEWTGDRRYIEDPAMSNFYARSANEYVDSWQLRPEQMLTRTRAVNANPDAKRFRGARGVPSYVESYPGLYSSSDLVATLYGGFDAYSRVLAEVGDTKASREMAARAEAYRTHLDNTWWSDSINSYHTFWTSDGRFDDGEGLTHVVWFNAVQQPQRIRGTVEKMLARKEWNIENISYFPLLWYRYGYSDEAYAILRDIVIAHRCNYPEVSYGMVEAIVSGAMGILPSASQSRVTTLPQITGNHFMQLSRLPLLGGTVSVRHDSNTASCIKNDTPRELTWEAAFAGEFSEIRVNGKAQEALHRTDPAGNPVSYVEVPLPAGAVASCEVL